MADEQPEGGSESPSKSVGGGGEDGELGEDKPSKGILRRSTGFGIEREKWGNKRQFLMSCIAFAVGLGNVWRFPAICAKNGGASFFLVYTVVLFVIGRPLFFMEMSLGQFSSKGSVRCWELCPMFTGVGYAGSVSCVLVSSYYMMLLAWAILYAMISCYGMYTGDLPWKHDAADFFSTTILRNVNFDAAANTDLWSYIPIPHLVSALLLAWIMVWGTMVRGIESSGKVAYVTALAPYAVLITLVGVGLALDGMELGMGYLFIPNFEVLIDPKTWFEAVGQCFFSMGIGFGGLIMFSSFNEFNHELGRDVLLISVVDFVTSILAGVSLMTILGFQATQVAKQLTMGKVVDLIKGTEAKGFEDKCSLYKLDEQSPLKTAALVASAIGNEDKLWEKSKYRKGDWAWIVRRCTLQKLVKDGGAGIAFVEYPAAMIQINQQWGKYLGGFLAFIFFLMLILLAVGSANGFVGTTVTIISDKKPKWKRSYIVTAVCAISFFLGLLYTVPFGGSWIDVVDTHGVTAVVYVLGFFEAVAVVYVYGLKTFCDDLEFMRSGNSVSWYFKICWAILPVLMFTVYMAWIATHKTDVSWTLSIRVISWLITGGCLIIIPVMAVVRMCRFKKDNWRDSPGCCAAMKGITYPSRKWGPKDLSTRADWHEWKSVKSTSFGCWAKCWGDRPQSDFPPPAVDSDGPRDSESSGEGLGPEGDTPSKA